jgi:hypothetical protein
VFNWAFAQRILLTDNMGKNNLDGKEVMGFVDQHGLAPAQIKDLFLEHRFLPIYYTNQFDNSSNLKADYWMSIEMQNASHLQEWFLELHDPHVAYAEVYELVDGKIHLVGKSGYLLPFQVRLVQHKNHFFQFSVLPGGHKTILVKFHSPYTSKFYASIVSSTHLIGYALDEYWFLGLYYGALAILLIYNLVLFINVKQHAYLWYSAYVAACIFNALREDGLGFQFIWPSIAIINKYHFDVSILLVLVTFCGFANSFLGLRTKTPKLLQAAIFFIFLYAAVYYSESYLSHLWHFSSYLYPLPYFFVYVAALYLAWQKDTPSIYFLIGFTSFILGVLCFLLRVNGLIVNNVFTIYASNFSILTEVVIMSYALASKYKKQNEELRLLHLHEMQLLREKAELDKQLIAEIEEKNEIKESINRELETKVAKRTHELHVKNEELGQAYKELSFYKEKLETDWAKIDKEKWELSQKINESIFESIRGKEVSYQAFTQLFPHDDACLKYLSELKWQAGFVCKQCENRKYLKGDQPYSRKCTRCTNRETATAGTLFHGLKFSLMKAMYITYIMLLAKDKYSNKELAEILDLRLATCANFKRKVEERRSKGGWENIILGV